MARLVAALSASLVLGLAAGCGGGSSSGASDASGRLPVTSGTPARPAAGATLPSPATATAEPAAGTTTTPRARAASGTFTSEQVVAHFKRRTGAALTRSPTDPPQYTTLDLGDEPTAEVAEFGTFTIYVVKGSRPGREIAALLAADDNPTAKVAVAPADAHGISWEQLSFKALRSQAPAFIARKRYGHNLLLTWVAGNERATDERWDKLDRVLTDLAAT
ncbi:hypothetical protein FSW04_06915 [Baekduia soli]|uniref:Uncharacterized protein n=1 Tax=Baekduia soli TaxID=496014 RepID=A0A5B8U2Q6_9ACTN|nr:hypothetical protein [Baekduia soli]QEC47339.1 hypothetical protein FSW04_06915 [Baekduia soli]